MFLVDQAWHGFLARRENTRLGAALPAGKPRDSTMYKALSSGTWKYLNVRARAVDAIVDRVGTGITSSLERTVWEGFWPADVMRARGGFPDLDRLVDDAGRWLLAGRSYFAVLCAADAQRADAPYGQVMDWLREAEQHAKHHAQYRGDGGSVAPEHLVRDAWASINAGRTLEAVGVEAETLLGRLMGTSGSVLDRTRAISRRLSEARHLNSFTAAAYVTFRSDQRSSGDFAARLDDLARRVRPATVGRNARVDAASIAGLEGGNLFLARGRRAAQILTEFTRDVLAQAPVEVGARVYLFPALEPEFHVHTGDVKGESFGDAFVAQVTKLTREGGGLWGGPGPGALLLASDEALSGARTSRAELTSLLSSRGQVDVVAIGTWNQWEGTRVTMTGKVADVPHAVDCALLTVISEEYAAATEWLRGGDDFVESLIAGRKVAFATMSEGGRPVRYACAQAQRQGEASIVSLIGFMSHTVSAKVVALVGIGGAISDKLKLGDVVIADAVVNYGPQAITADGPKHRGEAPNVHSATLRAANSLLVGRGDPAEFEATPDARVLGSTSYHAHLAPIGTGYAVVKYKDAEVRTWLTQVNEKVMLLETEAAGMTTVFYEQVLSEQFAAFAIVRGVSDHADIEKGDDWKKAACSNAVSVVGALIPEVLAILESAAGA